MARKTKDLETPFRKGEKVVATRDLLGIPGGTKGKIQIRNGLGAWIRYWVMFDDGRQLGQVDHNDLVRPHQLQEWIDRREAEAAAALRSAEDQSAPAAADANAGDDAGGSGLAAQIPAALLERSKAAKARLLGA